MSSCSLYRLRPDGATIALLEQHRDAIWPTVPEGIRHIVESHVGEQDYSGPRRVRPEQITQLAGWIGEHGRLPRPVLAYRQESAAWGLSDKAGEWRKRLAGLVLGDELSWEDRPVSTSLDPGY